MNDGSLMPTATPPPHPSESWADAPLLGALEQWRHGLSLLEGRHLFQKLMSCTLAVPVEADQSGLRLVAGPLETWTLSVFTSSDMLVSFATTKGWVGADGSVPWVGMTAREVFDSISSYETVEVVINPGTHDVKITGRDAIRLSQGFLPELPTPVTPLPGMTTTRRNAALLPADNVSDRVKSSLVMALENQPEVVSALFFRIPPGSAGTPSTLALGLKFKGIASNAIVSIMQRLLAKVVQAGEPTRVVVVDYETECVLGSDFRPFYRRSGY